MVQLDMTLIVRKNHSRCWPETLSPFVTVAKLRLVSNIDMTLARYESERTPAAREHHAPAQGKPDE
jgi:hypothetical protein